MACCHEGSIPCDMIPLERGRNMDVREALAEYQDARRRMVTEKTLSEAQRILGSFCDFCEEQSMQLEQIKPRTVDSYLDVFQATHHSKTGGHVSSHTVFLRSTLIKAFLNWCSQSEEFETYVKSTTVHRISNPKRDFLVKGTFSKAQIHALFQACEVVDVGSEKASAYLRDRDRAMILLLLDTGIRAMELCGLTMQFLFVNPDDPHIKIYGKGSRWREVGLGKKTREELEHFVNTYRSDAKGTDAPVFLTRHGQPITEGALFHIVKRLGEQAHIEGVRCSPHTFRHSYATFFMQASNDIFRLSRLLGHSSTKQTENYLKSFSQADARRNAVNPADTVF